MIYISQKSDLIYLCYVAFHACIGFIKDRHANGSYWERLAGCLVKMGLPEVLCLLISSMVSMMPSFIFNHGAWGTDFCFQTPLF